MKNCKCIYISANPDIKPHIVEVNSIQELTDMTGWEYFDVVRLYGGPDKVENADADLLVDDLGRLNGSPINMLASALCIESRGEAYMIYGDVVVVGHDGRGNTISFPQWTLDWVSAQDSVLESHKPKEKA